MKSAPLIAQGKSFERASLSQERELVQLAQGRMGGGNSLRGEAIPGLDGKLDGFPFQQEI